MSNTRECYENIEIGDVLELKTPSTYNVFWKYLGKNRFDFNGEIGVFEMNDWCISEWILHKNKPAKEIEWI